MEELKFRQAIFKDGKFHHWHYWGFCGYRNRFVPPLFRESQQYIGRKDMEGAELYKDDIVDLIPDGVAPVLATVEWNNGKSCWQYKRIDLDSALHVTWTPVKLVGNLWENPEMMEVNNE